MLKQSDIANVTAKSNCEEILLRTGMDLSYRTLTINDNIKPVVFTSHTGRIPDFG
jgi:hypothetical protein